MRLANKCLLTLSGCARVYREAQRLGEGPFEERVLRVLGITLQPSGLENIPNTGPALIVANHPHGIVDGLALATLVRQVRPDVRLLANRALARIPELKDFCFFVDPFDGPRAASRSVAGLRAAYRWLRGGGVLIVFPSGEVAHGTDNNGMCADSPWRDTTARLATATGAATVSAFIHGRNSGVFYAAGRVHPWLRTALLAREFLKKRGSSIHVTLHADAISREIGALSADACLVAESEFQVFCAPASAIPTALQEIGRLRALAYRAAGEGTGQRVDLDDFDAQYLHLFLWDRRARRIAGAYRIGQTDRIAAECGINGMYTRTLFRYDATLLNRLGPALELGRSFVRREYQRRYSALLLLWKGLGRFVARNPRYRVLFGAVSVSPRYSESSRQQLMALLRRDHLDAELSCLVEATNPPIERPAHVPQSVKELDLPVLLRHYLNLNARLIAFNVDRNFGDALDALMVVDLADVSSSARKRYLPAAA